MNEIAFTLLDRPVLWSEAALGFAGLSLLLLVSVVAGSWRAARRREIEAATAAERAREMDDKVVHHVAVAMPSLFVRLIEWQSN